MAKTRKPFNPFYPLLMVVGAVFAITSCAYGVMTVNLLNPAQVMGGAPQEGLVAFLDKNGVTLLMSQLGVLAALTFAAMATDDYWTRRASLKPMSVTSPAPTPSEQTKFPANS